MSKTKQRKNNELNEIFDIWKAV